MHGKSARHLHLWNSSRGELTDANLLQIPNLLLAPDLFFHHVSVETVLWESSKCIGGTSVVRNLRNASLVS